MPPRRPAPPVAALPLFATARDAYAEIRNFLAGRHVGATRDDALLEEVLKCVFVLMDATNDTRRQLGDAGSDHALARSYRDVFRAVRQKYGDIFVDTEEILLGPESVRFVHDSLGRVNLNDEASDPISDLFQAFIGSASRGAEGQFFTPSNAVKFLVDAVQIRSDDRVIDPACGAGGFLALAAKRQLALGVKPEVVAAQIVGIEKDKYLARMARIHLAVILRQNPTIYCADSLAWEPANGHPLSLKLGPTFDVVLANPPFGSKIVATSEAVQRNFELGFKWAQDRKTNEYGRTGILATSAPPQILFVERCLSLLKPGGRLGIVVPESLVSGAAYRHVVALLRRDSDVRAVVGMPEDLFKTSGKGGTHTKTCLIVSSRCAQRPRTAAGSVFMAEAKWCGNDSRGKVTVRDDLPAILENYHRWSQGAAIQDDQQGYRLEMGQISDNVLAPRYYDPEVTRRLRLLRDTHELVLFDDLLTRRVLSLSTGHEVGKLAYGTGDIPFIRTSDISNWELKVDPKHGVSEETFQSLRAKQDVRAGDILMVRDGTYLIGTCALITKYDERITYQSHIYKIRVEKKDELSPHLLLAVLSSPIVQRQIKSKRFTQDIIDSLGDRIKELILPLPRNPSVRQAVTMKVEKAVHERIEARELARQACLEVVGVDPADAEAARLLASE